MRLDAEIRNQAAVQEALAKLSGQQAKEAYAKALNDAGFMVRRKMQEALRGSFDRVTPWIERSPKVFAATQDRLAVSVAPTLSTTNGPSRGGKVGVDPQHVLQAQEFGGRRADKRSEVLLRRTGVLPHGYQTAIPRTPYPGSDDGRGNLRAGFVTQLLSYLGLFQEQGFKANMTERRKKNLQRGTAKQVGRRYFVAYGRLRGGPTSHLAPGIYAASGTHGSNIQPVLLFVKNPNYKPRISMERIAQQSGLQDYLDKRVRYRLYQAVERLGA